MDDDFNQSRQNGIWRRLENAVLATTGTQRVSVLAGPVFAADDRVYRAVRVPVMFWKVLVYRPDGQQLRARVPAHPAPQGSAGGQSSGRVHHTRSRGPWRKRSGLNFDDVLVMVAATVDPGQGAALDAVPRPVQALAGIRW